MVMVQGAPASTAFAAGKDSDVYKELALFGDIFERVRAQYVTPPDDKKLTESAINGMLTSLDPHSSYLNPEAAQDMRAQTKGEFGGLGIEVTMDNDLVKVIAPIDDTPASKAGVLAGDLITKIDGQEVRGLSLNDAVDKMRGEVGSQIELTIQREGADKPITLKIARAVIKVKAVRYRVENDVGYLRVISFTEQTSDDLKRRSRIFRTRFRATSSRASCWTCASIRVACSTRRSLSPMPSSTRARSSRPVAAIRRT